MKPNAMPWFIFLMLTLWLTGCQTTSLTQESTTTTETTNELSETEETSTTTTTTTGVMVTLYFDSMGGASVAPISQLSGSDVSEPTPPEKTGYEFAGWYTDEILTDYFSFTSMPSQNTTLYADWGTAGLTYEYNNSQNGYKVSAGVIGDITHVVIPKRHLGEFVLEIADQGFSGFTMVEEITLPEGLIKLGYHAFYQCSSLITVVLPDSLEVIFDGAFAYATAITDIVIPELVSELGQAAFSHCTQLIHVTFPEGLTVIWDDAFAYCEALVSLSLPEGLTYLGASAFAHCSHLTAMVIPAGVTHLWENAFAFCTNLSTITLPEQLTYIEFSAFTFCESLVSIVIPLSVTTIHYNAFYGCTSLMIFAEAVSQPVGWNETWNSSNCPVYWAGQWDYVEGIPTPND